MRRYYGIEFLRLITSVSVILYHYRLFFKPYNIYSPAYFAEEKIRLPFYSLLDVFYNYGIYGVHVFYAISGFVFAHVYLSLNNKVSSKEFFINRFARLYPLHLATLIVVTIILFINLFINGSFKINPFQFNDFYHFFLQVFFISAWGFESGHSFNAPIWSVSIEVGIYIIFFLFLDFLKKYKIWFVILLSIFLLLINKIGLYNSLFLECSRLFFSGVLIYYISRKIKFNILLFLFSLLLIVFSFVGNFKTYLFCPSLLFFFILSEHYIKSDKFKFLFGYAGNLTYALYLLHFPFILTIIMLQEKFNLLPSLYSMSHIFFFIYFFILLLIANFCFYFYEKPLNQKIRLFFLKKK